MCSVCFVFVSEGVCLCSTCVFVLQFKACVCVCMFVCVIARGFVVQNDYRQFLVGASICQAAMFSAVFIAIFKDVR